MSGADTNAGRVDSPWHSINHAIRATRPGDTIVVRGGVYAEYEIWIREKFDWGGSAGRWKTIEAYPGETPVIRTQKGLTVSASWLRIRGLSFEDQGVGANIDDGTQISHVAVTDNRFTGSFRYGAIELVGDDLVIARNVIELKHQPTELDHGIYLHLGRNNIVQDNSVSGSRGFGIHIYDERKSFYSQQIVRNGFSDILIEGNRVTESRGASGIVIAAHNGISIRNVVVRGNELARNNLNGIDVRNGSDVSIFDNVIRDNGREGIHLAGSPDVRNVSIGRNVIINDDDTVCRQHCFWYGRYHIAASHPVLGLIVGGNAYWPPSVALRNVTDLQPSYRNPLQN